MLKMHYEKVCINFYQNFQKFNYPEIELSLSLSLHILTRFLIFYTPSVNQRKKFKT